MNYKFSLFIIVCSMFAFWSCNKEANNHSPIDDDGTVPAQVTNIKVDNKAGKAVISYEVPGDPHLLFVKAVYTMTNGKQNEVKASYYTDSLVVNGFADNSEYKVKIFSVSRSGVTSEPQIVKVKPDEAAIWKVFHSIKVINSFGGYDLEAKNDLEDNVAIIVLKKNDLGEFERDNNMSIYTAQDSILSKERGLDTIEYRFGFFVRDHWGNMTDTVYKTVNPLFETELDRSKFREYSLPGDALENAGTAGVAGLWDGSFNWPDVSFTWRAAKQPVGVRGGPHMITFNMGTKAKLSRIWIRPYPESGDRYYFFTALKKFEIYGSADPSLNGVLDSTWHLLGAYTVEKPSGLPYGTHNQEDIQTAQAGFNWSIDLNAPRVQYIRIRCLENFGGGYQQSISELRVYGDPR